MALRLFQPPVHRLAADAQLLGRLRYVAAALLQRLGDGLVRQAFQVGGGQRRWLAVRKRQRGAISGRPV